MAGAMDFLLPEWRSLRQPHCCWPRAGGPDGVLPNLYVEVLIPKVTGCRGQAFGQ